MEGTLGEIRLFAGKIAPRNWEICNGKLLLISQNQALFSLLGTIYGGDGKLKFALPDLRGRTIIHPDGPYDLGDYGGEANHQLSIQEIPGHTHTAAIQGSTTLGSTNNPTGNYLGSTNSGSLPAIYATTTDAPMGAGTVKVQSVGSGTPHNNMQPYLGLNYIICVNGEYPTRQ